jgi:hypothetical protein
MVLHHLPAGNARRRCSQATTFLARTSGLSGTETTAYTNLICGMVTDGTWSLLDALYIFATNTTTTANLNLCGTSFGLTVNGSVSFTADVGYTGASGAGNYIATGYIPSTAGGVLTLNSASIGVYNRTSRTTDNSEVQMGANDGVGNYIYLELKAAGAAFYDVNAQTFPSATNANAQGFYVATRTGLSARALYKNGSGTAINTDTSAAGGALVPTFLGS